MVTQNENVPASDNVSNSDIHQPICTESISLEEKDENNFLNSKNKERVSKEIIQSIK